MVWVLGEVFLGEVCFRIEFIKVRFYGIGWGLGVWNYVGVEERCLFKIYNMWEDLSPKQAKTLEFIVEYIKKNSVPPTYHEIAKSQKINVKSVAQRLNQLKKKGYIQIKKNVPRGIVLTSKVGLEVGRVCYVNVYRQIEKYKRYFKLKDLEMICAISRELFGIGDFDPERVFAIRVSDVKKVENYLDFGLNQNDVIIVVRDNEVYEGSKILAVNSERMILGKIEKVEGFFVIRGKRGVIPIGGSNATVVGRVVGVIRIV